MKRIREYVMPCAILALMLLPAPLVSHATDGKKKQKPESNWFEDVTASGESVARSTRYSLDMLGITEMKCECTFTLSKEDRLWMFQTEPEITGVDRDGPAYGKLQKGDMIVELDGLLITTRQAGIRFANLVAGEPVELTVRREGRTRSITIVPQAAPELDEPTDITVNPSDASNTITIELQGEKLSSLARSIEELSRKSIQLSMMIDTLGLPTPPELASLPELNIDFTDMFPRGWIGFGLSFGGTIQHKDGKKHAVWRFDEPPSIKSVEPGSPAGKAGLQVNDVLLEIDGLKLDSKKGGDRFSGMQPGQVVQWTVRRGARTFTVETTAGERPRIEPGEVPQAPSTPATLKPVRYAGTLGDTEIEVRGGKNTRVEVNEETGEIVIRSRDSVVTVKQKEKK